MHKQSPLFCWLAACALGWLIPVFLSGSKTASVRFLPRHISYQYGCAALFTNIERSWTQAVYLVKAEGSGQWSEVPREVVSPMRIAGYRQRVDRIVTEIRRAPAKDAMMDRLAAHVAESYGEAFPDQPPVAEVRLLNTRWPTDDPVMTHPAGRWQLPPASSLTKKRYTVLGTWRRQGERWARVPVDSNPSKTILPDKSPLAARRAVSNRAMQEAAKGKQPPLPALPNAPFSRMPTQPTKPEPK